MHAFDEHDQNANLLRRFYFDNKAANRNPLMYPLGSMWDASYAKHGL